MSKARANVIARRLAQRLDEGKITWSQYMTAVNRLMYLMGIMEY